MNLADLNLPMINASLNTTAGLLLLAGYLAIRSRRETLHKWLMLSAFGVSTLFLACYLTYHYTALHVKFQGPSYAAYIYYTILISHILLAFTVPPLAIMTIYLGLRNRRAAHRRVARWTFPIWMYVSVTGVVIYLLLYHVYPSAPAVSIMI